MAKEEFRGEAGPGLEIELDGEIGGDEDLLEAEPAPIGLWQRSRPRLSEAASSIGNRIRARVTWRAAGWVAGAALLGFGVGALGEPAAKQITTSQPSAAYDLHFGAQPITAPGQAQMAKLTGAAWSVSPVTALVVHVVNDSSVTLHLHNGTLSGQHIANAVLVPDGTGALAPGQSGTLTAQVTLDCSSRPTDIGENTSDTAQPLTAAIPVSPGDNPGSSPATSVQLTSGSRQDDFYIITQLCSGLPQPLAVTVQSLPGVAPQDGGSIRITMHNITNQAMRYTAEFGFQGAGAKTMQVIGAGATIAVDEALTDICYAPEQSPTSPSIGVSMETLDGSYQTTFEEGLDVPPQVSACHE